MADKKNWLRLLAYVTGSINQELLLRNADRRRAPQPLSTAEGDRSLSWSEDGRTIAARKRRWKGAAARSRESRNSVWAKMQNGPPQQAPGGPNQRLASVTCRSNIRAFPPRLWRHFHPN